MNAYLFQLAEDIKANGGVAEGQSLEDALTQAHKRRQAFAMEMLGSLPPVQESPQAFGGEGLWRSHSGPVH